MLVGESGIALFNINPLSLSKYGGIEINSRFHAIII